MLMSERELRKIITLILEAENSTSNDMSKWKLATEYSFSQEALDELLAEEAMVPYVYDDNAMMDTKLVMFDIGLTRAVKKAVGKILDELIKKDEKVPAKVGAAMSQEDDSIYSDGNMIDGVLVPSYAYIKEYVSQKILGDSTMKEVKESLRGNYSYPVFQIDTGGKDRVPARRGFETIGIGHLVYKYTDPDLIDEREKYEKYTFNYMIKEFILDVFVRSNINTDGALPDPGSFAATKKEDYETVAYFEDYLMPKSEIINLYKKDIKKHTQFAPRIKRPITQEMFDALTSLAFNSGYEADDSIEYVIKRINEGQYDRAQKVFSFIAQENPERRERERQKFGEGGLELDYEAWQIENGLITDPGEGKIVDTSTDFSKFVDANEDN